MRLVRAGLLPVGGGFEATVDHASRLERLRRALTRDVELERKVAKRRVEMGKKLDDLRARRGPLEVQQQAMAQARRRSWPPVIARSPSSARSTAAVRPITRRCTAPAWVPAIPPSSASALPQ